MTTEEIYKGLFGVTVDETSISQVIQEKSYLTYQGYPVQDLAENCLFEEVAYLLWNGELPTYDQLSDLQSFERKERNISDDLLKALSLVPKNSHPMDSLRTAVSWLGLEDQETKDNSLEANERKAKRLFAKIPTIVAADFRFRKGLNYIPPRDGLNFSENFFYMCFGEVPDEDIVKAFDVSMVLYAEHGFNASTFTSRVITSSLADMHGAVTGGIASLKGPLHGGANEAVMHMLLEIKNPKDAEDWIRTALKEKRKIMGFGHRVYRLGDSRVPTMTKYYHLLAEKYNKPDYPEISNILKEVMYKEKNIYPNLDFPAGPAYYLMGFDIDFFTPFFVMSRITGWTAHIIEQFSDNRLIRPLAKYVGFEERKVTSLDQRAA